MDKELRAYIEESLARFIAFELEKGHSMSSVKEVLVRKGHKENLIDLAIQHLVRSGYVPKVQVREPYGMLEEELFENLVDSIVMYINVQLENGYSLPEIEKTLRDFGHSGEVIAEALQRIKGKRHIREKPGKAKQAAKARAFAPFPFIMGFLIILIGVTSISADEPFYLVTFGLLPALVSAILVELFSRGGTEKLVLVFIPIILTLVFFAVIASLSITAFTGFSTVNLMLFNLILGVAAALFYLRR